MPLIRTAMTLSGPVRGLPAADPRVTSYKGIPFAAPPVGENRWRAPLPCAHWKEELQAFDYAPIGPQAVTGKNKENIYTREWHVEDEPLMDEDCLYLNVWAPAEGRDGLPVFVWFFGGGLQVGSTTEMEFDGERIARRGIVVVTVNYRLNAFGFLAHPELSDESPEAPANFGFLDQQMALHWVRDNIAAFGGDPGRVTIGGQSAGGMSVSAQIAHKENRGLFQNAAILSGIFLQAYPGRFGLVASLKEAEERGSRFFAEALGVKTLKAARALPWQTILEASLKWKAGGMWPACVDGAFLRYSPDRWYQEAERVVCPVLMGSTMDEFLMSPPAENEVELKKLAKEMPGLDADSFLRQFSRPLTAQSIKKEGAVSTIDLAVRAAAKAAGSPVYAYRFGADIPGWDTPGAFHSVDLWFFFETLAKCWRPFVGRHYDLARQMCDYLSNFVHAGDPNGQGTNGSPLPYWPALDTDHPVMMSFQDSAQALQSPLSPVSRLLLASYMARGGGET